MYCPDCATLLDEVAVGDSCPGCAGGRRSAIAMAETAHAVATVPVPLVVTESRPSAGPELVTVSSATFRSASETTSGQQTYAGQPPQNEEDVLQVCRALRTALAREGIECGRFRLPGDRVDDVDAVADRQDGTLVQVQVTRIERRVWRELAIHGTAESRRSAAMLADDVATAIESKLHYPRSQRRNLVLALDAMRSPGHSHAAVVQAFSADRAAWVADLGFEGVWLVGATAALTSRLS